jgi:hypothetical protein
MSLCVQPAENHAAHCLVLSLDVSNKFWVHHHLLPDTKENLMHSTNLIKHIMLGVHAYLGWAIKKRLTIRSKSGRASKIGGKEISLCCS